MFGWVKLVFIDGHKQTVEFTHTYSSFFAVFGLQGQKRTTKNMCSLFVSEKM